MSLTTVAPMIYDKFQRRMPAGGVPMGFRVRSRGVTIEADSERELRSVLSILGVVPNGVAPVSAGVVRESTSSERLLPFFRGLSEGNQTRVLGALAEAAVGLRDVELRQHLDFRNNSQLAGVMAGLSKNARANGLNYEDIIEKQPSDGRAGSLYFYKLTDGMRDVVSMGD